MFDVFYKNQLTGLFAFERPADNIAQAAALSRTKFFWFLDGYNDYAGFNFFWQPPPWEQDHVHVFPSQHQRNGGTYFARKDSAEQLQYNFRTDQIVSRNSVKSIWSIPVCIQEEKFDFSWHPDFTDSDYEYHFPTQWQESGGPIYPGTLGIKLEKSQCALAIADPSKWKMPNNIDINGFDFSWHPDIKDADYEYHFGTQWQKTGGPVYNGSAGIKLESCQTAQALPDHTKWIVPDNIDAASFDFSWHPDVRDPDYEYHFGTQWQSSGGPVYQGSAGVKIVYTPTATALPDMLKWVIPSGIDTTGFDFSWHPSKFEPDYEYRFPTQWQREGGPIYKGTAGIKFVAGQKIRTNATQVFYMDFLNPESKQQLAELKKRFPDIKSTRYVDNHLNVFKRIMSLADTEFVWIVSSICDYSNFDFTWHPDGSQREMIHCFPTGVLKRGDTFYIHVPSFKQQMYDLELLDWFNIINYCEDQIVLRFPQDVIKYDSDNLTEEIGKHQFKTPYTLFTNRSHTHLMDNICLWSHKDREIVSFCPSNSVCYVPREAKSHIKTQIYDYPYVNKTKNKLSIDQPLDIIYISNGEPDAEHWYNYLKSIASKKVRRVQNINGRTAAYQAAADLSHTPWFFAVFAKLEITSDFNFYWQPDYFQQPKHYIFNSKNILNGLEYGHQGLIAYNKKLVLENNQPGIDFTLSQAHESVPILSGVAHFNQNPWMTWRTAFREVLKLKHFNSQSETVETSHRLKVWTTRAEGENADWCLQGAKDAFEYYEQVGGDYDKIKLSFDWAWLAEYAKLLKHHF